ncbi:DEAD/DEAH box helicase [Jiangella mangrovi]|uniref:ATP-dependent Lhr-like helicase n=1 Tax=Jiangella mangrovi TaxID=1524084 RepID=A0A7W9LMS8_9ACTN|nr:DEAD/DEAH box helicase [Jiangella mangrovi]MBB5789566.1 ATP-dependent Lhr-like helicase [Jiangella mangrovi]
MLSDAAAGHADPARAFGRLHPGVQRWIWNQGWTSLRTVQALAVEPILSGRDVLISAATAAGKTEAAWLPICSDIAEHAGDGAPGIKAMYVGPLKALINDQHLRLETLGESADIPVHRWHGDVPGSAKRNVRTNPDGILLITPESLEALFVRDGSRVARIFAGLRHVVIDEFHSFIGSERGAQLQSLMHRIDRVVGRRVPRIGLSATLADLSDAADFLRPRNGPNVALVVSPYDEGAEIRLQVRGYVRHDPVTPPTPAPSPASHPEEHDDDIAGHPNDAKAIGDHLFRTLRGSDNLVFANSRASVEAYTDILSRLSADQRVPNEFVAHHGNLSKEHREDIEARLRSSETPATAICTSTLEMGIDIGSTDSVAQVGAPPGVAALRQRLGRSGRRGKPATLRAYISEPEVTDRTPPADMLRARLFQTVAMTELMLNDRWYEPPNLSDLHLSTLVQQVLSVIAQHGGATAVELYGVLCGQGPFARVGREVFVQLLQDMGTSELLVQSSDGLLLAGRVGDHIVNHYSFYSAFHSAEEYRLMVRGRTLGTIPVVYPVLVGSYLIFAGLRWQVVDVDAESRIIELTRSTGGRPPAFAGTGTTVADEVRRRMHDLYTSDVVPIYLDTIGQSLLEEGRRNFRRLRLGERRLLDWGDDTVVLPWRGDTVLNTIAIALNSVGLKVSMDGVGLTVVGAAPATIVAAARELVAAGEPEAATLAEDVTVKTRDKYDEYLSDHLLCLAYASHSLDVRSAWQTLAQLAGERVHLSAPPRLGTDPSVQVTPPRVGETPFAVVDIETTGFAPLREDRIVEIAIVQADPEGVPTGRWSSLVNPLRDPGPTHVHGILPEDLLHAPTWVQIADWVADQFAGRIVVAHNAGFDLSFVNLEFERADIDSPAWPTLDTLELASHLGNHVDRSLQACCDVAGIPIEYAHTASGDADATTQLLAAYLRLAAESGVDLNPLVADRSLTPAPYPRPAPPFAAPRKVVRPVSPETAALITAVSAAYSVGADPATNAYLAVLDRAVLSAKSDLDVNHLLTEAARFGLDRQQAIVTTHSFLTRVVETATGMAAATATELLSRIALH